MSDILQNTDNTRLYGLNTTNCCSKDQSSEKVANALIFQSGEITYSLFYWSYVMNTTKASSEIIIISK